MKVYVVVVVSDDSTTISKECYMSVEGAIEFVSTRSDNPTRIKASSYYSWKSESSNNVYLIHELTVRG